MGAVWRASQNIVAAMRQRGGLVVNIPDVSSAAEAEEVIRQHTNILDGAMLVTGWEVEDGENMVEPKSS